MEHFFKGLTAQESQISAIPPERYGDRFVRFISGITKTRERAEQEKKEHQIFDDPQLRGVNLQHTKTEEVIEKAERVADRSVRHGANEENVPERRIHPIRSPSAERGEPHGSILPIVEEAGESASVGGRSNGGRSAETSPRLGPAGGSVKPPPTPPKDSRDEEADVRPPTPPKNDGYRPASPISPPTPPKDERGRGKDKTLPVPPTFTETFTRSPSRVKGMEMEEVGLRVEARVS